MFKHLAFFSETHKKGHSNTSLHSKNQRLLERDLFRHTATPKPLNFLILSTSVPCSSFSPFTMHSFYLFYELPHSSTGCIGLLFQSTPQACRYSCHTEELRSLSSSWHMLFLSEMAKCRVVLWRF